MTNLQIINLTTTFEAINTPEAYSQDVFKCGANLVIPYINLELIEEVEGISEQGNIDFSYVVIREVEEAQWNYAFKEQTVMGRVLNPEVKSDHVDYFIVGGEGNGGELKVRFKEIFLVMLPDSKVSNKYWVPYDTPNFRRNLSRKQVRTFFDESSVPEQVRTLISCPSGSLTKLTFDRNITDEEAEEIKRNWADC